MDRRKQWDLPEGVLLILCIMGGCFLLGGLGGYFFAGLVDGEGGEALGTYLSTYFYLAQEGSLPVNFGAVFWEQVRIPLGVFVLGFTALGIVGIPLLFCMRGFALVYSVTCFLRLFGTNGLLPALVLFGLTALFTIPALFVLGAQGIQGALALLRRSMGDRTTILSYDNGYFFRAAICGGAVGISIAIECVVIPPLLEVVAGLVL